MYFQILMYSHQLTCATVSQTMYMGALPRAILLHELL